MPEYLVLYDCACTAQMYCVMHEVEVRAMYVYTCICIYIYMYMLDASNIDVGIYM